MSPQTETRCAKHHLFRCVLCPQGAPEVPNHLKQALTMASRGVRVVFFQGGQKGCARTGWKELASTDAEKIFADAKAHPEWTNYACVAKPGEIFIFDDDSGGTIRAEYEATGGRLQPTLKVKTWSGKFHYYFRYSDRASAIQKKFGNAYLQEKKPDGQGELWSLRMNNAYGVGPGSSVTEDGKTGEYAIVYDAPIVAAPDDFLDFLIARYEASKIVKTKQSSAESEPPSPSGKFADDGVSPIGKGGRDDALTSIGGKLRRGDAEHEGMEYDELLDALREINARRCVPPMDDSQIQKIARSLCRYEAVGDKEVPRFGDKLARTASVEPSNPTAEIVKQAESQKARAVQEYNTLQDKCETDSENALLISPYPNDAWEGTLYADFAHTCRHDGDLEKQNYIPAEFLINGVMTAVGAICGHRIYPAFNPKLRSRFLTFEISRKGGIGKDEIKDWLTELFSPAKLIRNIGYAPHKNIGCLCDSFGSARGFLEAIVQNPIIFQMYSELTTLFEKFGIAGSGVAFKDTILECADSNTIPLSRVKGLKLPDKLPPEIHNSILGFSTIPRWEEMSAEHNLETFIQRSNMIATEETRSVAILYAPDLSAIRAALVSRIGFLERYKLVWDFTREAKSVFANWHRGIQTAPEDEEVSEAIGRIQVYALRIIGHLAFCLAPPPAADAITDSAPFDAAGHYIERTNDPDKIWDVQVGPDIVNRAIRVAEVQMQYRASLMPIQGKNFQAIVENQIKRWMSRHEQMRWPELKRRSKIAKYGHDICIRALGNLEKEGTVLIKVNPEERDRELDWIIVKTQKPEWRERRGGVRPGAGNPGTKRKTECAV